MRKLMLLLLCCLAPQLALAQSPTPPNQLILHVWWSDSLYPLDNARALRLLQSQIEDFNALNTDLVVELRAKPTTGNGSILNTLLTAQPVAPDAIPDLVLLPHSDLLPLVQASLVQPLDNWLPDSINSDLLPNALALGEVDNTIYGVPYALNFQHLAYSASQDDPTTFRAILEANQPFFFPGQPRPNQKVNDLLLAQYLDAGGRLLNEAGLPTLDEAPLMELMTFYSAGVEHGIFTAALAQWNSIDSYWSQQTGLMLTTSTYYLKGSPSEKLVAAPLPSADGQGLLILEGWVWALTTTDPIQQLAAWQFIEWMLGTEAQADYTQAVNSLPARQRAYRLQMDSPYLTQLQNWLNDSMVLPLEQRNNLAAEQLQLAFVAVLNGASPESAIQNALEALTISN